MPIAVLRHVAVTAVPIIALIGPGCAPWPLGPHVWSGAQQTTPHQWHGVGGLVPTQKDKDAGLVGMTPGFDIRRYATVIVDRCSVVEPAIKDDEDRELARTMPAFLQAEMVRRLGATGLFDRVVSLGEATSPASPDRALRIECVMTRLGPGSLALRFGVGFGAGRTKAEVEFRFIDAQTGTVVMVTADRRVGASAQESEALLRESFDDMARDLAKFLMRLSEARAAQVRPGHAHYSRSCRVRLTRSLRPGASGEKADEVLDSQTTKAGPVGGAWTCRGGLPREMRD